MALDPLELMVIGVIVVVIFMWGPGKIPELARALGRAKKEFDMASKELTDTVNTSVNAPRPKTGDELLLDTARQLGIYTEGKTREQISQEIVARSKQGSLIGP
jgi:sec-independent protein translocase protein TatA